MPDLQPSGWVCESGRWLHRPRFKVVVNAVLRAVQPWSRKLVIYSRTQQGPDRPRCVGYGLGWVLHEQQSRHSSRRRSELDEEA